MPKSRNKKVKHQDFAKVKLKVGRKLPKAANETDASFKSRGIQISDQFKTSNAAAGAPSTKRKHSFNDLLSHCHHYSTSMRHDALVGLRELLTNSPQLITKHLAQLLERVAERLVDKDHVIRMDIQRLLKLCLPQIPANQMKPFFAIVNAHLCCAMTHIDEGVQQDSLLILDLLLEWYPELVVENSSQLLPNFLEQISKQMSGSGKKNSSGRILVINPSGRQGSSKWRAMVFERLHKLLQAIISLKSGTTEGKSTSKVEWKEQGFLPLSSITNEYNLLMKTNISVGKQSDMLSDNASLTEFVHTMVPLLLQCWVEVGPGESSVSNAMSTDALTMRTNVLNVLSLLVKYICTNTAEDKTLTLTWLQEKYMKEFSHYFMNGFPYSWQEGTNFKKGNKGIIPGSMNSLNLAVCDIMTSLVDPASACSRENWFKSIIEFLKEQLENGELTSAQLQVLLRVVGNIFSTQVDDTVRSGLLQSVIKVYISKHDLSSDKRCILEFLSSVFLNGSRGHMTEHAQWIITMPQLLQQVAGQNEATVDLILSMKKAAGERCETELMTNIQPRLSYLLNPTLVGNLTVEQQLTLVEVIYTIETPSVDLYRDLAELILSQTLKSSVTNYMLKSLSQKIIRSKNLSSTDIGNYLSFMFTVVIGETNRSLTGGLNKSDYWSLEISPTSENWKLHLEQSRCALDQLVLLPDSCSASVLDVWINFIGKLQKILSLPFTAALSILYGTSKLSKISTHQIPVQFLDVIAQLMLDLIVTNAGTTTEVESLKHEMILAIILCVEYTPGLWDRFLLKAGDSVSVVFPASAVDLLRVLGSVVSAEGLKQVVVGSAAEITRLVKEITAQHPELECGQQYASIMYTLSTLMKH